MPTHIISLCHLDPLRPLFAWLLLTELLQFSIKGHSCQNGCHPHHDEDGHDDPEANWSRLADGQVSWQRCMFKKKKKTLKKREWHCYGMLNSSERHYDSQQIRQAFHFWRNLISKNCEWLLLMILEWINAILTLFFGEGGWKAHTESQYSIKRVTENFFSKLPKNRYDEQSKEKDELKFRHLNKLQILETLMCDRGRKEDYRLSITSWVWLVLCAEVWTQQHTCLRLGLYWHREHRGVSDPTLDSRGLGTPPPPVALLQIKWQC